MSLVTPNRNTVLFLGAGFSYAVGTPTMNRFGDRSTRQLRVLRERHVDRGPLFKRHIEPALRVAQAGEVYEAFRSQASQASLMVQINPENLEDVFCMAELCREADLNITLAGKSYRSAVVLRKIKEWLWDIYKKYLPVDRALDPTFTPNEMPYRAFATHLRYTGLLSRISVLSTNYDLVFEIILRRIGLSCCYPLGRLAEPIGIASDNAYLQLDELPDRPVVCKLHGSVNYFAPENPGGPVFVADQWSGKGSGDRPEVLWLQESHDLLDKAGTTPDLVPPTYAKLHQSPWLSESFEYAVSAIQSAKTIIFIGYSFPPSDGFMVAMMRAALGSRDAAIPPPHIWVFDPCSTTIQRYRDLFNRLDSQGRLHCHCVPFSNGDDVSAEVLRSLDEAAAA